MDPLATAFLVQSPALEFTRSMGRPVQLAPDELTQTPTVLHDPSEHVAVGVPEYPLLQTREQEAPEAELATQLPFTALAKFGSPEHGEGEQLPEISQTPEAHVAERVPVYPKSQAGVQEFPEMEGAMQVPAPA